MYNKNDIRINVYDTGSYTTISKQQIEKKSKNNWIFYMINKISSPLSRTPTPDSTIEKEYDF